MSRERPRLVAGPEHPCGYLPDRLARNLYLDPRTEPDPHLHSALSAHGFRRSGPYMYRPDCEGCRACVPARVPVASFTPRRSDRRIRNRNRDLEVTVRPVEYHEEHFRLYRRYLRARHPGGGMDGSTPSQYLFFLNSQWSRTRLWELRLEERVVAVAVVDEMPDALSAVYTFFEPTLGRRSLGVYAVLHQIERACARDMDWLYLGYWIAGHDKMGYKSRFRPIELLTRDGWQRFDAGATIPDVRGGRFG